MSAIRHHLWVLAGVIVIAAAVGWTYVHNAGRLPYQLATVERGDIKQEVLASGNVASPTTINLQFQNAGKLTYVAVQVGDTVKAGEVLARQDTSLLNAQMHQVQASLDAQSATLASLQQGTRPEQIAVTQSQVESDKIALTQASQSVINAIQSAYTISDDVVHNKVDLFIDNPRSSTPSLILTTSNAQLSNAILTERVFIEGMLSTWQTAVANLTAASGDLTAAESAAQENLYSVTVLLSNANSILNTAIPTVSASQANIDTWTTTIATARSSVNAAVSSLNAAITAHQNSAAALDRDQKTLTLELAGSTGETIAAQQAQVAQAQAQVAAVRAQISQLELTSPVAGTVTQVNVDAGESITPSIVAITLIPNTKLETDVNVSEDNIANVKVGDAVRIILDAFPGTRWQGTVAQIDPAQTVIGGAIYYKTTAVFDQPDSGIKPGMTANVVIETGSASSTLLVPASAIQSGVIGTFVQVYENGAITNRNVATGIHSQNGMVEITSGLSQGERVVIGTN